MSAVLSRKIVDGLPAGYTGRLGVAVSGGSDSLALLYLLRDLVSERAYELDVVTVDHGLRPEAAEEAAFVAETCAALNLPHTTLRWTGWDGQGNTQNAARLARYQLIGDWAAARGIPAVAMGHTQDDQAETVLMRLARGAGVDGLSAMLPVRSGGAVQWVRPMLDISRADLRAMLTARGVTWKDDPTNEDTDYERIRMRQALRHLRPLGIDAERLALVAGHMAEARDALQHQLYEVVREKVTVRGGAVCMGWPDFCALPKETARRFLSAVLKWIGGDGYPPRHTSVTSLMAGLTDDGAATAAGGQGLVRHDVLWLFREYERVRDVQSAPDALWDGRWSLLGPSCAPGAYVAALGPEGLGAVENWRDCGMPRAALLATPALWSGGSVLAAPVLQPDCDWSLGPKSAKDALLAALLSH
ncbi:tRNA lysidine(34) synthetase TilS [uncultured Roseobacter sp.]|uniref:tRNA lysidine(34) synthetase TilS n=1 Tax=uncultured Roseobacter sp. TaxID=114847 RepID=UPI002601652D|nr:tRNA lysidine(34) synthetase TilS [uncultured Roseobacter sp.]